MKYAQTLTSLARYQDALEALNRAASDSSNNAQVGADLCSLQGNLFMRQGDYQRAAQFYAQGIALSPGDGWLYTFAGNLEWQRGDLQAAERLLRQGTATQGEAGDKFWPRVTSTAWYFLSSVLWALERYEEALNACEKAVEQHPEYKEARHRLEDLRAAFAARADLRRDT